MAVNVVPTIIYSCMMGVTIFALLGVLDRPKNRQTLYLAGLQLLLLVHILGELFIYSGAYRYAPALAGAQFPIRMLLGPALYFYALASMSPEKALPKKAWILASLGPVIVILGMLPFILGISAQEKLALANPATRDPELFQIALLTCLFAMISFLAFTGAYLFAAFRLQVRHRQQMMERFSDIEQRSMDWFKVLLILWGCVWFLFALDFGINFLGLKWFGTGIVIPAFEACVLMLFSHYALRQPNISDAEKGTAKILENKTREAILSESQMQQIADKLKSVMANDHLFLEEDLSLKRLSDAILVTENHISETLSQFLNTNFFQFVNGYRLEQAKSELVSTSKNVSEIAYNAGFNSKPTFNTAFKKDTGMTPIVFRKQAVS